MWCRRAPEASQDVQWAPPSTRSSPQPQDVREQLEEDLELSMSLLLCPRSYGVLGCDCPSSQRIHGMPQFPGAYLVFAGVLDMGASFFTVLQQQPPWEIAPLVFSSTACIALHAFG